MWKLFLVSVCLGATQASIVKRQEGPLQSSAQQFFTKTFIQALLIESKAAYDIALVEKDSLNADVITCKANITTRRATCSSCSASECSMDVLETVEYYLGVAGSEVDSWFSGAGATIAGWEGWNDMDSFFTNDLGNFFGGIGDWHGWDDMATAFTDMGSWFEGAGISFVDWWDTAFADAGSWFETAGKDILNAFGWRKRRSLHPLRKAMLMRSLGEKLRSLANTERGVKSSEVARRGELSDEAKACMEKCDDCEPFLQDTPYMITSICGPEILQRNESLVAMVSKIQWIVTAANDTVNRVVVETTNYDFNMNTWMFDTLYVKARFPGGIYEFKSGHGYDINNPGQTATDCAPEYWDIYDQHLV